MSAKEKKVAYTSQNTYCTLNQFTQKTERVWLVFHGIGYLSRYFLKHFSHLNSDENYFIAPQAPSKYYLKNEYKYVGASWLTKENTKMETENLMAYLDQVCLAEAILSHSKLVVFGFSQGVSVALRWIAKRKIDCQTLVLYAGGIPNELNAQDFEHLNFDQIQIKAVYGEQDAYLNEKRLVHEKEKLDLLFQKQHEVITFKGGHEMVPKVLSRLVP